MAKKSRTYVKKSFESNLNPSDTSANLYHSMLVSPAWLDLTNSQRILYLVCKDQYYHDKKFTQESAQFTMNQEKWKHHYKLYNEGNEKGFYRDMNALIEHGFIVCVTSGKNTRTKSVYGYSDQWRYWGTDKFSVSPKHMTAGMLAKLRKNTPSHG